MRIENAAAMARRVAGALWAGALRLGQAWEAEHTRAQLRALSDRTLDDIGLTRAQIDALFR